MKTITAIQYYSAPDEIQIASHIYIVFVLLSIFTTHKVVN